MLFYNVFMDMPIIVMNHKSFQGQSYKKNRRGT